jgi:outer membrane beta-barrel protein
MMNRLFPTSAVQRTLSGLMVVLLVLLSFGSVASAQNRSLYEGPVVRRELLYRSSKLEIAPALGVAFGGIYEREIMVGAAFRYHLTNSFSVGLNANFAPVSLDSSLTNNLATANPEVSREVETSFQRLLTDVHVSYVPIAGKINLFGNHTYHYDFSVGAGVGGALLSSNADDIAGFKFGPALTLGMRFFVSDNIAINLRTSSYFYSSALAQRIVVDNGVRAPQPFEERFRAHTIGMLGISVFLPGDVRVSR